MPWRKPLPEPITLADGRVLETLVDALLLLTGDGFSRANPNPALDCALELLFKAAQTNGPNDLEAATDQVVRVLAQRRLNA